MAEAGTCAIVWQRRLPQRGRCTRYHGFQRRVPSCTEAAQGVGRTDAHPVDHFPAQAGDDVAFPEGHAQRSVVPDGEEERDRLVWRLPIYQPPNRQPRLPTDRAMNLFHVRHGPEDGQCRCEPQLFCTLRIRKLSALASSAAPTWSRTMVSSGLPSSGLRSTQLGPLAGQS